MIRVASILLILPHLLQYVAGQTLISTSRCIGNENYTTNSTFKANLDILLSTLPTNITPYGFLSASRGQPPDQAYAIVLCRGDIELAACQQCVSLAATGLTNSLCPHRKQAISWHQDSTCTLRYSDQTIFGTNQMSPSTHLCSDYNAASTEYGRDLRRLLEDVKAKAMNGSSQRKFATGDITSPHSQTIHALVQCSPDLTRDGCSDCLNNAVSYILVLCPLKVGGRILYPSCSVRYENYFFFSQVTSEGRLAPPVPQPLDRSPTGKNGDKRTRIIVIIVVSVVVGVILAAFMGILLSRRRKQKPTMKKFESTSEISTVESLQYSFSTIKAATNDFSEDNKLGEGGFGVVYKGLLEDGREIAVKRLSSNSSQGYVEFINEALLLAKLCTEIWLGSWAFAKKERRRFWCMSLFSMEA